MNIEIENDKIGKIEPGIPIPSRRSVYKFGEMKIGDSMLTLSGGLGSVQFYKSRHPEFNYASRKEGDFIRIWRIAPKPNGGN
jgi:hypothetical protein